MSYNRLLIKGKLFCARKSPNPIPYRRAFGNIYAMLKPGGDCFIEIIGRHLTYDIWRKQRTNPKWAPYMGNLEDYISRYHDAEDSAALAMDYAKEFFDPAAIEVSVLDIPHSYDQSFFNGKSIDQLFRSRFSVWFLCLDYYRAIDFMVRNVPVELRDDYVADINQLYADAGAVRNGKVEIMYQMIMVYATK